MTQSKEFPQYQWVTPKSYTKGRKAGQPTVIFIHTTEGSEGPVSAENGAGYDARRTDGTSTHFFTDSNSVVQCVLTTDESHATRSHGNDVGIAIEVCGKAGQTKAQWADAASAATIEQTARLCVQLRKKYGKARFPLVNLTPAQLRKGMNGFAEHKDATLAWPEDGGTHTDPGPNFPWSVLFARITQLEAPPPPPKDDDLVTTQAEFDKLMNGYVDNPANGQKLADAILNANAGSKVWPTRKLRNFVHDVWGWRDYNVGDAKGSLPENSGITTSSPIAKAYAGIQALVSSVTGSKGQS